MLHVGKDISKVNGDPYVLIKTFKTLFLKIFMILYGNNTWLKN